MGDWPIILICVAVGIVIGKVLPPIRRWRELNQILASAGLLGRRDRIPQTNAGSSRWVSARESWEAIERPGHSRAGITPTIVRGSARTF